MRTTKQINDEISRLRALKPVGPFRSQTADKIAIAIEELVCGIDQTAAEFGELNDSLRDMAQQTRDWKEGFTKNRPSEGWGRLVK